MAIPKINQRRCDQFEIEACEYLQKEFQRYPFTFENKGGPRDSDIEVKKNGTTIFTIEAKLSPSFGGQFVVLDEPLYENGKVIDARFEYSHRNQFPKDEFSSLIVNHLNQYSKTYYKVGSSPIALNYNNDILKKWVKNHYESKNSLFIITSTDLDSFKAIIPLDKMEERFTFSASIRRKPSGSNDLSISGLGEARSNSIEHLHSLGLSEAVEIGGNLVVKQRPDFQLKKSNRVIKKAGEETGLLLSRKKGSNDLFIKKRGTTNNINVLFHLSFNGDSGEGLHLIKNELKKHMKYEEYMKLQV